jgi:hypothetical protein
MATYKEYKRELMSYYNCRVCQTKIYKKLFINDQINELNEIVIEKNIKNSDDYFCVGLYYEISNINYKLMKKYYLLAIIMFENHNAYSRLVYYCERVRNRMMIDYLFLIMKYPQYRKYFIDSNILIENICIIIDNICELICFEKLDIKNFGGFINFVFKYLKDVPIDILVRSINDLCTDTNNEEIETLKYLNKFLVYIGKIKYKKKKDKQSNKLLNLIFKNHPLMFNYCQHYTNILNKVSIQELLKIKYNEYLEEKYKPGGKIFIEAKLDFEKRSVNERSKQNEEIELIKRTNNIISTKKSEEKEKEKE